MHLQHPILTAPRVTGVGWSLLAVIGQRHGDPMACQCKCAQGEHGKARNQSMTFLLTVQPLHYCVGTHFIVKCTIWSINWNCVNNHSFFIQNLFNKLEFEVSSKRQLSPWQAAELPCGSHREPVCRLLLWPCSARRIAGDTVAYIQCERNAVGGAALRRTPSSTRLNRLFWFARRRAEARVSRRETRLFTEHTPVQRHAQRASYKNIRVSPSLADGCYHGDAGTNGESVRASAPTSMSEETWRSSISHDSSRVFAPGSSWLSMCSSRMWWC